MRLAIWASNPTRDDTPPLEIILELDKYRPLPTCNKDNEEILQYKVLPLTRARDFLKIITSFAGLIELFSNPDLSLYYTLTRKRRFKESARLGEWTLYITVFDHKERTTRVYTQENEIDTFYSTTSDAPIVDVGHFLLEI
jgi:transposase InsO family protein